MAAYAALLSLKHTISRHLPNSIPELISFMSDAREEIDSTLQVLQVLYGKDSSLPRAARVETWGLVESQLLKLFPFEYLMVQLVFKDVERLRRFINSNSVDASDIEQIRDEAASRLEHVLESLLSSLRVQIKQKPLPHQIFAEMDGAKQQIHSFIHTVEKIKDDGHNSKNPVPLWNKFPKITRRLFTGIIHRGENGLKVLEATVRRLHLCRSNRSRERLNALEVQIREEVCWLEDLLETRLSDQFPVAFHMEDINEVKQYIPLFTQLLGRLKLDYMNELIEGLPEDNDDIVSWRNPYSKNKSKMVGLSDEVSKIKTHFGMSKDLLTVTLFGMGGIGKTTVAEQVFDDPSVLESFEIRAWVEVGQKYQLKRIKQSILDQVLVSSPDINIDAILAGPDERVDKYIYESLKGRRYLIVLDDVWEEDLLGIIKRDLFPDNKNGSRVLLTTRRITFFSNFDNHYEMRFLTKEESWELLCEKVFGEKSLCPTSLTNAGKKIAECCEGLPLTIVTVGELLSKVERTPEKWNELADNRNSLIEDAYGQMSKVLLPSYSYLPQHLKACFLYMGVFPRNYEISRSELQKLWFVEKIHELGVDIWCVLKIVQGLCSDSLLMKIKRTGSDEHRSKNWSLHSSFWHLCKREALNNKFSYVINYRGDSLLQGIKGQRRLCIHKNVLLGIKDVHKSISSVSTAHSLLCTGPPHQYPVPICFSLKLLRTLNALRIRLYEFPMDVLKLFQLRYLALTCYGNLPSSISKLGNLEILIVGRHLSIGSSRDVSYLPAEIWDMKELKHLQVMGSDLPDPCEGTFLPNLKTLSDVSARSCNRRVFQGTPNLNKLGIRIELTPDGHATETLRCFDHIHHLEKLKSLKCVVVNPSFGPHIEPPPLSLLPKSLDKLSLSGLGYPWKDMSFIASLPCLFSLKLRCYAFRGPKLEIIRGHGFQELYLLKIQDTDLVNLTVTDEFIRRDTKILLENCYKLENIISDQSGCTIEVVNCFNLKTSIRNP